MNLPANFLKNTETVISGQYLIQSFGVAGDLQGFQSVQHPSGRRIQAKTVGFWPGKRGSNRGENTRLHRGAFTAVHGHRVCSCIAIALRARI